MNKIESPYLTAKEAAAYMNIAYSTFRKLATSIKRTEQLNLYRREDLDAYLNSKKPRKKR